MGTPPYEVWFHVLMPPIIQNFGLVKFNPSVFGENAEFTFPKVEAMFG